MLYFCFWEVTLPSIPNSFQNLVCVLCKRTGFWKQETTLKNMKRTSLKKIRKLASNEDLYFGCLERFESHYQFFRLMYVFFNFCESFISIYIIFYIKINRRRRKWGKDLENDSLVEIRDVNASSLGDKLNIKDNAAKMLDNRLQGNFVSKNVVNLTRRNLTDSEISFLSKGLTFVPTSNFQLCKSTDWFLYDGNIGR